MDYLNLLEHSYQMQIAHLECAPRSHLEFLGESIFCFTTYDPEITELFAQKAVEVCVAVTDGRTFEYIQEPESYKWFLLMCNMPFFYPKLEWGSSIRGAWWDTSNEIKLSSSGLWIGEEQVLGTAKFNDKEWKKFVLALIEFSQSDIS